MKLQVWITVISILFLYSSAHAAVAPWEIEEIIGKDAPQFTLSDIKGNKISLSSFKGKVILLNFWATWCPSCKNEMPSLTSLYKKYREKGIVVVAISMDKSKRDVQNFLSKSPIVFPVLLDSDLSISHKYKVFAFPTTFLIDREGVLREKYIGEEDWMDPEIIKPIEKYLKQ